MSVLLHANLIIFNKLYVADVIAVLVSGAAEPSKMGSGMLQNAALRQRFTEEEFRSHRYSAASIK
jgi:hypothetical protein